MAKVEIKGVAGLVLYTAEVEDSTPSGLQLRAALEKAANDRAYLGGADLRGADLRGADLGGAHLGGADLGGADLRGAKLTDDLTLVGERPVLGITLIGSRSDTLFGFVTNHGLRVRTGCFFGTPEEFAAAVQSEHGTTAFGREYLRALELLELHAELYPAPVESEAQAA